MVSEGDYISTNAAALEAELDWLAAMINLRFTAYFTPEDATASDVFVEPHSLDAYTPFTKMLRHYEFGFIERLALALALATVLRPQLLDIFYTRNSSFDRPFTEFGGHRTNGCFIPTGETLAFIVGGTSVDLRLRLRKLFSSEHLFRTHQILAPSPADLHQPLKTRLTLSEEICSLILLGEPRGPQFGAEFPAQHVTTKLTWDDLVLHPGTRRQLEEILAWMEHGDTLLEDWGMAGRLRPGLRCLFYGPPGTGKSMTAVLLGAVSGRKVYKIDLSLVVSKYIGETEKNLGRVFEQAENKNWILFFDEA
ncbi:MAG: ATP-binding protein, partial [Nannocystaceae bacterium]